MTMMMMMMMIVKRAAQVVEALPTVQGQKDQTMAGSSTDTLQLEHRLGTTVSRATLELERSHVPANRMGNGNQSCQLVNVRKLVRNSKK